MTKNTQLLLLLICLSIVGIGCEKEPDVNQDPNSVTDSRDGDSYATVTIGGQIWMAENLRYDAGGSGTYMNASNPDPIYGRMYTWATLMNGASSSNSSNVQGICPTGWHVPSDTEWNTLEIALGMSPQDSSTTNFRGSHGAGMKSTTGWDNNGNGSNSSGFNAYPTGTFESGNYFSLGEVAAFWTATEDAPGAWARAFNYSLNGVQRISTNKTGGFSCRCVKD